MSLSDDVSVASQAHIHADAHPPLEDPAAGGGPGTRERRAGPELLRQDLQHRFHLHVHELNLESTHDTRRKQETKKKHKTEKTGTVSCVSTQMPSDNGRLTQRIECEVPGRPLIHSFVAAAPSNEVSVSMTE